MESVTMAVTWEREGESRWHGQQTGTRLSRDLYIIARSELTAPGMVASKEPAPLGWAVQLGSANPERDAGLVEVMALVPDRGRQQEAFLAELVDAHFCMIGVAEEWLEQAIQSNQAGRTLKDRASRVLFDLMRLRYEALVARGATTPELEQAIERRLADTGS